jgi:delta-aminolevulinic acid dehydratase/porphobilinogen synthase
MKYLLLSILFLFGQSVFAASAKKKAVKKKEVVEDKVYAVEKTTPEIIIGEREKLLEKRSNIYTRPSALWSVSIVRSGLKYQLPSLTAKTISFSPTLIGLSIGKKIEDQFFLYKGYYEISGEWQRFKFYIRKNLIFTKLIFFKILI